MIAKTKSMTRYRFESLIRSFLKQLLNSAIQATPNKELSNIGLNKKKLIKMLSNDGIIKRKERILDKTNSDKETPCYQVTYKVIKKDWNDKIERMYKNNVKKLNECDCGGAMGGDCGGFTGGATNASSSGQFVTPLSKPIRRNVSPKRKKKKKKRLYMTESQLKMIQGILNTRNGGDDYLDEVTSTFNSGNYTYDAPLAVDKNDPTMKRGNGKNGATSIPATKVGERNS